MTRRRIRVAAGVASLALWTATAVPSLASPGQVARFRSGAEVVLVDVEVMRNGRPVTGLTADDFELTDSGVRQAVQAVSLADQPLSIVLALDVSASVRGEPLEDLKRAALKAADALRGDDESALLTFSQRVALRSGWTKDRTALHAAVGTLSASGLTALYDAVFASMALRERATGRAVLIVFSDGYDTASWLEGPAVIQAARRSDVVVYAVFAGMELAARPGLGGARSAGDGDFLHRAFQAEPSLFRFAFLEELTSDTGGELIQVSSSRDLSPVFARIVEGFRTRYLVTYAPAGVPASGWHPIEVTLKGRNGTIRARRGYTR